MSDGSNASQKVLLEPLKSIGAQDLIQVGSPTYEGFLRKRGGRFQSLLGSSKWKQRFVVISQGCVYCFKDEYAEKPQSAFSLAVYGSVLEASFPNILNVFEIQHEYTSTPSQFFACETEAKKTTWMAYIEEAIRLAHQHIGENQKLSSGSDEGISMTPNRRKSHAPLPPLPPTPDEMAAAGSKYKHQSKSEYSLESDDEGEEYTEIKDHQETRQTAPQGSSLPKGVTGGIRVMQLDAPKRQDTMSKRPALPLPATPGQKQAPTSSKTMYEDVNTKPSTGKPDYINEDIFKEEEFFFNSTDKAKAHRLLSNQPVGTFLVRLGNSTPTVLSVQTSIGIKEFQIVENEASKVSINRTQYFPTLQNMLCYYNQNDLPKKEYTVKLKRGYKSK